MMQLIASLPNNTNQMQYIEEIKLILKEARQKTYQAINSAMVEAYWKIGQRIVLEEQNGQKRATYGKEVLKTLSKELSKEFGKGFSERNLRNFRKFYLTFSDNSIWQTVSAKLSWSHLQIITAISNQEARNYYLKEAAENMWSVRTLDRNITTLYYNRILSSQVKETVVAEMLEKTNEFENNTFDFIKNPAVLEFLNLPTNLSYTEQELEKALVDNLQKFILELGKGFAFVERQQLIRTETSDFYIDLVFYNFILKCFVIIELKIDKITHQDIGQLDMYVRMYDDLKKQDSDNPTIGILLCTETDRTIAKYSVLNENQQLFATKYLPFLPTEEELIAEIEKEKTNFILQNKKL
jgi:predicted nuclease of restriction endonuclease-like (RecB) superfamily